MGNRTAIVGLTGLLAIAAMMRGERPATQPPQSQTQSESVASSAPSNGAAHSGRDLLRAFLGVENPDSLVQCTHEGCYALNVLIATLPDPFDSALDWGFDAYLESIRRAFEASRFITDRFYLPDRSDSVRIVSFRSGETLRRASGALADGARQTFRASGGSAQDTTFSPADTTWRPTREVKPGVILFRSVDPSVRSLWLLYLVNEVPTGGIYRDAMREAIRERRELLGESRAAIEALRILGPVFSGSARSLRAALDETSNAKIEIVSGTTTDASNAQTLGPEEPTQTGRATDTSDAGSEPTNPDSARAHPITRDRTFNATVHPDSTMLAVLNAAVLRPLKLCPDQVAVLRETTSQYGVATAYEREVRGTSCPDSATMLDVAFPMNIASLRAEFARNPEASSSGGLPAMRAGESRVPLSLQDAARRKDTPTSYSSVTPAALELVLDEIVRTLRAREIRAVVLVGTDIRDKIFLGDLLRKELRDVQLITFESNTLYLHRKYASSLRGMLVLSTYPLILENQRWSGADRNRLVAFASEGALGVFNATSMLLGNDTAVVEYGRPVASDSDSDGNATRNDTAAALSADADSSDAGTAHSLPPVWITAVGRESLLPILAFDAGDSDGYVRARRMQARAGGLDLHSMSFLLLFAILGASLITIGVARMQDREAARDLTRADECAMADGTVPAAAGSVPDAAGVIGVGAGVVAADGDQTMAAGGAASKEITVESVRAKVVAEFHRRSGTRSALPEYVPGYALVQDGSLVLHSRLYSLWMLVALAGIAFPLLGLSGGAFVGIVRSGDWRHPDLLTIATGAIVIITAILAVVMWAFALARGCRSLRDLMCVYAPVGWRFAKREFKVRRRFGIQWVAEVLFRFVVGLVALVYLLLVLWYAGETFLEGATPDGDFTLYFHRAIQFDGGLSPLVPLALIGVGCLGWSAWHRRRIHLLLYRTPFEQALQAARCTPDAVPAAPAAAAVSTVPAVASPVFGVQIERTVARLDVFIERFVDIRLAVTRRRSRGARGTNANRAHADANVRGSLAAGTEQADTSPLAGPASGEQPGSASTALLAAVGDRGGEHGGANSRGAPGAGNGHGDDSVPGVAREVSGGVDRTVEALVRVAHEIRERLFLLIPPPNGVPLFMGLVVLFAWLVAQFGHSFESMLTERSLTAFVFEAVYKGGLVAAIAVTAWCTYRMRAVWEAVLRLLAEIANTPLLPAFGRLPRRLTHLTRLKLLPGEPASRVPAVAWQQWRYLVNIYKQDAAREHIDRHLSVKGGQALHELMSKPLAPRHVIDPERDPKAFGDASRREAAALRGVAAVVAELWTRQPTDEQIREEILKGPMSARRASDRRDGEQDDESRTDRLRQRFSGAAGLWLEVAEEFLAGGIAEYIEALQAQIRNLGWFVFLAMLLGTALLSSYPFHPQALFKILFVGVLLLTVASLLVLVTQMNRNEVLSQIDNTTPGVVNWDTNFVLSLVFYGAVPLIALLGSEFAPVRDVLFAWVEPMMHTVAKF